MKQTKRLAMLASLVLSGLAQATEPLDAIAHGWYAHTGLQSNLNYAAGTDGVLIVRNWFVFDLSSITLPILTAQLQLWNPADGYISPDPTEDYVLYDVSTDISLLMDGFGGVAAYDDLGSGTMYGSYLASAADNGTTVIIPLNADAIAELNNMNGLWAIGGALESLDDDPLNIELLFGTTADVPFSDTQLVLTLVPAPGAGALLLAGLLSFGRRRRA